MPPCQFVCTGGSSLRRGLESTVTHSAMKSIPEPCVRERRPLHPRRCACTSYNGPMGHRQPQMRLRRPRLDANGRF